MPRASSRRPLDPIRLEIFHHLFAAVCEQSGAVLQAGAASPNVRERRDFSVALFDPDGRLVAQAAHIPVHLGSAADSVVAVREALELKPGDTAILNDPYRGGTHLPDVTMVRQLALGGRGSRPWFGIARAHHADIGGAVPGSMGVAEDLIAEGQVIPPVLWRSADARRDAACRDVRSLVFANVRGVRERSIDFAAQEAALSTMETNLRALADEQGGARALVDAADELMGYSERVARSVVAGLPSGVHTAHDELEDDGFGGGPFPLGVEVRRRGRGETMRLQFVWDAPPAARGGINANRSIVTAACVYVLRCLCPDRLPTNDGVFRAVEIVTEPGSLLDPASPAPVAGGNVETSQRLVDLGFAALAPALPERIPAGSAGTMTNLSLGARSGALYETLPGGAGAGPLREGASAVQTHMTNTRNTPIEEAERTAPIRVRCLTVRRHSGGVGARRGGDGIVKEVEMLEPMTVSLFAERRTRGGLGVDGGRTGAPGRATVLPSAGGRARSMPAKGSVRLEAGDAVRLETPGGGGHGRAGVAGKKAAAKSVGGKAARRKAGAKKSARRKPAATKKSARSKRVAAKPRRQVRAGESATAKPTDRTGDTAKSGARRSATPRPARSKSTRSKSAKKPGRPTAKGARRAG